MNPNRQSESKGLGRGAGKRHPPLRGGVAIAGVTPFWLEEAAQERNSFTGGSRDALEPLKITEPKNLVFFVIVEKHD